MSTVDETIADRQDLSTVQSVDKALMIVEALLRDGAPLSAREIALRTGINRTTAHRLINALMHRGWIEKAPGVASYRVSLRFLVLTDVAYQSRNVFDAIRPLLIILSERSRETVHVGVLDGFDVIHVDKVDSPERIGVSSKIGIRAEPRSTALGKALLSVAAPETVAAYIDHLGHLPGERPFDRAAFLADLDATRERGYSIDDEDDSVGVRCIGAPVRSGNGEAIFAISITGPGGRFTRERADQVAPALIATTDELSHQLGWPAASTTTTRGLAAGAGR